MRRKKKLLTNHNGPYRYRSNVLFIIHRRSKNHSIGPEVVYINIFIRNYVHVYIGVLFEDLQF